jgi:hypothetical protein
VQQLPDADVCATRKTVWKAFSLTSWVGRRASENKISESADIGMFRTRFELHTHLLSEARAWAYLNASLRMQSFALANKKQTKKRDSMLIC